MKKITVIIASLIVTLGLCSCTNVSDSAGNISPDPVSVFRNASLPKKLPDDIKCTEVSLHGKTAEVSDEVSERLSDILRRSYKTEVSDRKLEIAVYFEAEFSNGMSLNFADNDDIYAYFSFPEEDVYKIVSISEEDAEYVHSLIDDLFGE